jgi:heterodisulfide reductase subunit C
MNYKTKLEELIFLIETRDKEMYMDIQILKKVKEIRELQQTELKSCDNCGHCISICEAQKYHDGYECEGKAYWKPKVD